MQAERFYSIHPDETAFVNFNSNPLQQQLQLPQPQLQHPNDQHYHRHQEQQKFNTQYSSFAVMIPKAPVMPSGGEVKPSNSCSINQAAAGGEISHFSNSTNYYKSSASNIAAALDVNNNQPNSLHYFDNNNNNKNNNNYLNKIPALIDAKGKYNGDSNYLQPSVLINGGSSGGGGGVATFHATPLPLTQHQPTNGLSVPPSSCCHYTHNNANGSYYTRNRYMPYNHNRACAAAAAAAAAAATANTANNMTAVQAAISSVNMHATYQQAQQQQQQQQFAPIYKSGMYSDIATAMAAAQQLSAPAATSTVSAGYDSSTVASMANTSVDLTHPSATVLFPPLHPPPPPPPPPTPHGEQSISNAINPSTLGDIPNIQLSTSACETIPGMSSSVVNATEPALTNNFTNSRHAYTTPIDPSQTVTLQITNLDYSMDEASLRNFLINQLKPITPVVSLIFESSSYAKVTVPDLYFAKQVVSYLHRKKIGHKRMLVSYTRDSSLTDINTLRCQVAGLLKDVPYYTLPMYKFRELFQSRFKTSISVLDLYKMQDICSITTDSNEEKFITLQPDLINSLETSPLMKGLQHSVPYCTVHFKREHNKGWAEQEIEPLPNVFMTISEIQKIIYPLLKAHPGDIPVASLLHCIEGELNVKVKADENGVNLEHLVCCVQGIQIQVNNFGIKILSWLEVDKTNSAGNGAGNSVSASVQERGSYSKNNTLSDPLYQISREVIELVKMSPKSTMKFNRFIPAYHNHFGKQCRVADYGYTKLIELFEALSSVVQIMGDGENRQITLTHRTQIRRFTSDLLRILRTHGNKSVLLSELPAVFSQTQNRNFDVTDYGVCDIIDILDGLVNSNIVVVTTVSKGKDLLISIPKRKQTNSEIEKTCVFAGEMVELFRNAPQYTILFQKFVRSYHYHFSYQCRLSDYGFLKLADLMEAIQGVVQMEAANDEERKVFLSPKVAQRVFAEQCEELIRRYTGSSKTKMKLEEVLELHKKKFGYQIQAQTLGVKDMLEAIERLPYVEMFEVEGSQWIICHNDDALFRNQCYRACKLLLAHNSDVEKTKNVNFNDEENKNNNNNTTKRSPTTAENGKIEMPLKAFIELFNKRYKENINVDSVKAMRHAIEIISERDEKRVSVTKFMMFLVNIVRLLEQRPSMFLYEIKNALDCNISACFEFGYPNLFTVLAAYPDIFSVNLGVSQERSEISLLHTTELRLSTFVNHQHLFGSLKLPSKQKLGRSSVRNPLSEYNNNRISNHQGPPAKTRAISNDTTNIALPPTSNNVYKNANNDMYYNQSNKLFYGARPPQSQHQQHQQHQQQHQHRQLHFQPYPLPTLPPIGLSKMSVTFNGNNINYISNSHQSNTLKPTTMNFHCNKENSFNTSFNTFNNSFNSTSSSNGSFSELNSSYGSVSSVSASTSASNFSHKLWDRRNDASNQSNFYNENAIPQFSLVTEAPPAPPPPPPLQPPFSISTSNEPATLYEFCANSAAQICPMYEPPKPDTPPTDNVPFWIDPIWSNSGDTKTNANNTLNIKLPEFKNFNVLPMCLSPYTLSKTENLKQQVFNFGNHDRKIA